MQGRFPIGIAPFSFCEECRAVKGWDGIGGEMVVGRQKQAIGRKPLGTGAQKKTVSRGTAKMREAADKTLEVNSDKIAKSLLDKTLAGNSMSAKLLLELAEGQTDCQDEEVVRRRCNLDEELASEPEWEGELDEAEAETGLGQREPEG
jgi:hypothetical protein